MIVVRRGVALASLGVLALAPTAGAQIAVSANDNKVLLDNGVMKVVPNPPADTVSVIAAGTVAVGGPKAGGGRVMIAPDGKTALVSRNGDNRVSVLAIDGAKVQYTKRDLTAGVRPTVLDIAPNGKWAIVGNLGGSVTNDADSVSLVDLTARPPRVVDTIGVRGATPEGLKISPDGSIVAVVVHNGSNRPKDSPFFNDGGKLVIVRVKGDALSRLAEGRIGHWSQGAAFTPDGKRILVGDMVEKDYWVFAWNGKTLRDTGQRVKVNGGPAAIRVADMAK